MKDERVVFFGTGSFSLTSLKSLIDCNYLPVAVVTKPDQLVGRGQKLTPPPVKDLANQYDIKVLQPENPGQIVAKLRALKPTLGVVVAYGKMIPLEALKLFPKGIVNIHGSLLPKYRGASTIEGAILNGDKEAGVTLMQINSQMDQGPIYAQAKLKLTGRETKPELYEQLSRLGAQLLVDKLPAIASGTLRPKPQDDSQATYVKLIQKNDGRVDWRKPADQIEREIRAYYGWPGSTARRLAGKEVIITAAHVADTKPDKELAVKCGDGRFLVIDKLKPAGKIEMTGREFLAGYGAIVL